MADRVVCSCITCPKCGTWVVVRAQAQPESGSSKTKISCPAADCAKEFEFAWAETHEFEIPLSLFERRHFYRSELRDTGT